MGMCKKCQSMFSDSTLTLGYCVTCYPKVNEEVLEKAKEDAEKKKQQEQQEREHEKELDKILILNGTVNKEYILHGMVSVVGEEFLNQIVAVENAHFTMRQHLVNLDFDGILNTRIESTVTHGRERDNQKIPFYSVILYGDAFSYV